MGFQGKVAIVTGASKGIGEAAALALAGQGAAVAVVDLDQPGGETVRERIQAAGQEAIFVQADVADEKGAHDMAGRVLQKWGRIDLLVNNAGIYAQGDLELTTLETWQRILAINLTGVFLCSQAVLAPMIRAGRGVIVNVASEAGLVGIKGQLAYNVSKAAVIQFTRSCAVDLAEKGIRVNCVCPGTTDTPLVRAAVGRAPDPGAARRRLEEVRPLNRLGTPEEIAAAIVFLASDEAGYATGAILSIDGGYTAQ